LPGLRNGIKTPKPFIFIQIELEKICFSGIKHPINEKIIQPQDLRWSPKDPGRSQKWYKMAKKSLNLSRIRERCKNREAGGRRHLDN
ncbi:MAG: hypothetical protein IKI42_05590, partial [Clostridia bacterium]|nr:hypothetical protein [Clostridia bacterium]